MRLDFEVDKLRTNAALGVMAALRVMVAELWLKSNWIKLRTQNTRDTFIPANRDEISHVKKLKSSQLTKTPGWPDRSRDVFSHTKPPLDIVLAGEQ